MICPQCQQEGLKSTIQTSTMYAVTAMAVLSYYDEEGRHHRHDPNRGSAALTCSKGHALVHIFQRGCDVEGCDFEGFSRLELDRRRSSG